MSIKTTHEVKLSDGSVNTSLLGLKKYAGEGFGFGAAESLF